MSLILLWWCRSLFANNRSFKENQENPSLFAVMKSARTAPDSSPHAFRMIFPSSVGAVCTDFDEGVCDDVDGDCQRSSFRYPL
jgi:hypothetical protein